MTAAAVRPSMTERELQAAVVECARWLQWEPYHTWVSLRSPSGFPDVVLGRPGAILVAELKSERGRVTEAQQRWLDFFTSAGIPAFVWRPSDWLDGSVERILRGE